MQQIRCPRGVHDRYYGGFARAVSFGDEWLRQMDVECLYGLIALEMLRELDPANITKYDQMRIDAAEFLRRGVQGIFLHYDPLPQGDSAWHRNAASENVILDDCLAYALAALYTYEGW